MALGKTLKGLVAGRPSLHQQVRSRAQRSNDAWLSLLCHTDGQEIHILQLSNESVKQR